MHTIQSHLKQSQPLLSPSSPIHTPQPDSLRSPPSPPSSGGATLFITVTLAVVLFFSGLLYLLVRFVLKNRPSFSDSDSDSIPFPEISISDPYERRLQRLFEIHDSGLDQILIDALPVFEYKKIVGKTAPFDCAVCLCEFSDDDKLKLIPPCSHAFHTWCIEAWLLSNSTCPLCRGAVRPDIENPHFGSECDGGGTVIDRNASESEMVLFHVKLGKFRSSSDEGGDKEAGSSSSSSNSNSLGGRRCYSMGSSYQYVVGDFDLQVALSGSGIEKGRVTRFHDRKASVDGGVEDKRISIANKNDSISVSKIWLWSKKGKYVGSSSTRMGDT